MNINFLLCTWKSFWMCGLASLAVDCCSDTDRNNLISEDLCLFTVASANEIINSHEMREHPYNSQVIYF